MKHLHKIILAAVVVCLIGFVVQSCGVLFPEMLPPEQKQEYTDHQNAIASAQTPEQKRQAEAAFAEFQKRVADEQLGPVLGFLGPWAAAYPFLRELVPLIGSRGRKLFAKAVGSLNPTTPVGDGKTTGIAFGEAGKALWAYVGGGHSTPEGAKALAKETAPAAGGA